jgi:hypothetical protein
MRMIVENILDFDDNNNIGTALHLAGIVELDQLMATTRAKIDTLTIQQDQMDEPTHLKSGGKRKLELLVVWLQLQHQQNNYQALTEGQWQALTLDAFNEYRLSLDYNEQSVSANYNKHCASLYYVPKPMMPNLRLVPSDGELELPLTTTTTNTNNDNGLLSMGSKVSDGHQAQTTMPSLATFDATSNNKCNDSNGNNTMSLVSSMLDCFDDNSTPKLAMERVNSLEHAHNSNSLANQFKSTQTRSANNICDADPTTHKSEANYMTTKQDSNNYASVIDTDNIAYKLMSTVSFTDLVYTVVKLLDAKRGDDGMCKSVLDVLTYGTLAIGMVDKHADTLQFWPMLCSLLVWGVNLQQSGKIIDGYSSSTGSYEMKVVEDDTYAMVGSETQYY